MWHTLPSSRFVRCLGVRDERHLGFKSLGANDTGVSSPRTQCDIQTTLWLDTRVYTAVVADARICSLREIRYDAESL